MTRTILLLGMTGTGKSTFISAANGTAGANVNHSMTSCTIEVSAVKITRKGETIQLVDTPGFNTDGKSDEAQLKKIVDWLKDKNQAETTIDGILYLHDVHQWPLLEKLRMKPHELCDPPVVSVVSTNWPPTQQWQPDATAYPGPKVKGSVEPFDYTTESAWKILDSMKSNSAKMATARELGGYLSLFSVDDGKKKTKGKTSSRRVLEAIIGGLFKKYSRG